MASSTAEGVEFTYRSFAYSGTFIVDKIYDRAEDWRRETCTKEGELSEVEVLQQVSTISGDVS